MAEVGVTLSERDRAILRTLGTVHVVTARQLVALHGAGIGPRQAQAVLASLTTPQVLSRLPRTVGGVRAGSAGFVYTLGPVGVWLLDPSRRRRSWEVDRLFLAHTLGISQLYTDVVLAARAGCFELETFTAESTCWRTFYGLVSERLILKQTPISSCGSAMPLTTGFWRST
ncbi:replication-relaxation family protein [Actinomadura kijaniata]|uniref:replication-relaxation family protein n=1 Tax=Actinomadura kijaniata TaxID=46161 RepID=UPI003F198025